MRISDWSSDVCSSDLEVLSRHEKVVGVLESAFEQDLRGLVFHKLEQHETPLSTVLLLVDDALLTSAVSTASLARTLHATPHAAAVQLKLHPGIARKSVV